MRPEAAVAASGRKHNSVAPALPPRDHQENVLKRLADFYFRIDLRSLAAFRIGLACVLIADALARWPNLEAFYTSLGVLPIEAPLPKAGGRFHFSLFDYMTSLAAVRAGVAMGILCYVCLLVGYKTRLFLWLSFIIFISLCNRNILIRFGGDVVVGSLLLWMLFLPAGARFSLDAYRKRNAEREKVGSDFSTRFESPLQPLSNYSIAAFAIILQLSMIYGLTSFDKGGETWQNGTAIYYALHVDRWTTPIGQWVRELPIEVIKTLTWMTLTIEYLATPLILLPVTQPWARRIAIILLFGLHTGIWLTMWLGTFQMIMIAALVLLLRPDDWRLIERAADWLRTRTGASIGYLRELANRREAIRGLAGAVADAETTRRQSASDLPLLRKFIRPAAEKRATRSERRRTERVQRTKLPLRGVKTGRLATGLATNAAALTVLSAMLVSAYNRNLVRQGEDPLRAPTLLQAIVQYTQLGQGWNLFAPNPPRANGWWVVVATTESGRQYDPTTGKPPTWSKPHDLNWRYDRFWYKYMGRLAERGYTRYRSYFAEYLNRFTSPEADPFESIDLFYCTQRTPSPEDETNDAQPVTRRQLIHFHCGSELSPTSSGHDPDAAFPASQ